MSCKMTAMFLMILAIAILIAVTHFAAWGGFLAGFVCAIAVMFAFTIWENS